MNDRIKRTNDELKADRPTIEEVNNIKRLPISILVENVRSVHNVGSIFRSADGFGAEKIYLTGYTACPPREDLSKTALGSEKAVPWEHFQHPIDAAKKIISKGISAGKAQNTYRGQVSILPKAANARNFTQCDSLLIGDECGAHTIPYIEVRNPTAQMGHEATTSKVNDDQLFYLQQRGIDLEEANYMVINGFCRGIFKELPFEFAMEASQLLRVSLEGAVG